MKKRSLFIMYPSINGVGYSNGAERVFSYVSKTGKVSIISQRKKSKIQDIPLLRGIIFLIIGTVQFFSYLFLSLSCLDSEQISLRIEEKVSSKLNISKSSVTWTIIGVLSFILGFFAFTLLPRIIGRALNSNIEMGVRNLIVATSKISIFYIFLLSLKIIPSMRVIYAFNSAGNKIINMRINNQKNNDVASTSTISYHCSTNFLTMIIFGFIFDFFVISLIGIKCHWALEILFNISVLLVVFSLTYELFYLMRRQKYILTKLFILIFSYLTTSKPSHIEIEVALAGNEEIEEMKKNKERELMKDKDSDRIPMSSILTEVRTALKNAGIEDTSDAEWIIATVLNLKKNDIKLRTSLTSMEVAKIRETTERRKNREPLSKIFGFTEFYGRKFFVDKNVLSPRMETEQVCEEAISKIKKDNLESALDLCTGSGIIAITLQKECGIDVSAIDISKSALKTAMKNAKEHKAKINFIESDMFSSLKKKKRFDIIVSNPPYLETKELSLLEDEVKNFDPILALDGGDDGMFFYREIAEKAPEYLNKNGKIVLEISYSKAEDVKKTLQKNFTDIRIKKDYFGNDRIVSAKVRG